MIWLSVLKDGLLGPIRSKPWRAANTASGVEFGAPKVYISESQALGHKSAGLSVFSRAVIEGRR